MQTLLQDVRFGLRMLAKNPGFTAVAVLTLALGIGANTAVFSLLSALLFQTLPVRDPQQLVRIGPVDGRGFMQALPGPMFDSLRTNPLLDGLCGVSTPLSTVEVKDIELPVPAHALSGSCYDMLGITPEIGRLFTRREDIPAGPLVAVLSHAFWQNQFGADPKAIGQTIRIDGAPFTIIGVTKPRFQGLLLGFPPSVSFPITHERRDPLVPQKFYWGFAFARLKPAVTTERLRAQLDLSWRKLMDDSLPFSVQGTERAESLNRKLSVISGDTGLDYMLRNRFQGPLFALMGVSGLVLLVSCVNLANLLLARGLQRSFEIAVRIALGATRLQVIRQLLLESAILTAAGVGGGVLLANAGIHALIRALSQAYSGFSLTINPDMRMFVFASTIAVFALTLFAIFPSRQTSAVNLTDILKTGRLGPNVSQGRARRLLICGQVALTFILVASAGFFVGTLRDLRKQSFGFKVNGLLDAQLLPVPGGYSGGFSPSSYYPNLLDRMEHLPGVSAVSLSHFAPLLSPTYLEEIRPLRTSTAPAVRAPVGKVSDRFLTTMGIPLLRGEDFHRTDPAKTLKTAIVSYSLAKRLFAEGEALGRHVCVGSDNDTQDVEIVGVAADARLQDPRARDLSFLYLNSWQYPDYLKWSDVQLRYSGDSESLVSAIRALLKQAGHEYPNRVRAMSKQRDISLLQEQLLAALGSVFGMLALGLAAVGLFGLLSFFVVSRTNEIGIRMALGAERRGIAWLVLRESLVPVGSGLLLGLPLSWLAMRAASALLYGMIRFPLVPVAFSAVTLLAVAVMAAFFPLRRAINIDPLAALRYE